MIYGSVGRRGAVQDPSAPVREVPLDLSEVTFVDSTGLTVFVSGHRRAMSIGCSFAPRSPRPAVLRTLRLTGIDLFIDIDLGNGV